MPKPKITNKSQLRIRGKQPQKLVKQIKFSQLSQEHKMKVLRRLGWLKK